MPPRDEWRNAAEERPLHRVLGIRAHDIGSGWAEYTVEATPASSDGRGSVLSFAATVAADLAVLAAATTTVDRDIEENNGTAELNLTHAHLPEGPLLVRAEVSLHASMHRVVVIRISDARGTVVAEGRGTYAVRPLAAS